MPLLTLRVRRKAGAESAEIDRMHISESGQASALAMGVYLGVFLRIRFSSD